MIDEKYYSQYGEQGLEPTCITIHNTSSQLSARELFNYLNGQCRTTQGTHFVVDSNEIIEVMPCDWKVYHTGKGRDYAFHHSIAIEICSNINDEEYLKGQELGIELINDLMEMYNIPIEEVYFHQDWNQQFYCPSDILNRYGNKKNFIDLFFKED